MTNSRPGRPRPSQWSNYEEPVIFVREDWASRAAYDPNSDNETAAHVAANGRMTLMFMSFDEKPLILRAFGSARVIHPRDDEWPELVALFPTLGGSRQIFDMSIDRTRVSCGTGVPIMELTSVRADAELEPFYAAMSDEDLQGYWAKKNTTSLDGFPTKIFAD